MANPCQPAGVVAKSCQRENASQRILRSYFKKRPTEEEGIMTYLVGIASFKIIIYLDVLLQETQSQSHDQTEDVETSDLPEVVSSTGPSTSTGLSTSTEDHGPYDIGSLFDPSKSVSDIITSIRDLPNGTKYSFLYNHVKPPKVFPPTLSHGFNRRFSVSYLDKYSWLLYSPKLDGIFCGPCALLLSVSQREDKGFFVNRPFSNWVKTSCSLLSHSKLQYHLDCVELADAMKGTIKKPDRRINVISNEVLQKKIDENRQILRQIVRAVVYLGKQGIAFRGRSEDINSSKNPGNFLALLKSYADTDSVLFNHLYHTRAKNATYLSPITQNQIINIIGYDIILSSIISEAKEADFFSVLADELSCHNVEHLPICIRFVDSLSNIREEFLSFVKLERVRASDIASAIIETLEGFGLSLGSLRGQGYDGASTMSGEKAGVQALIKQKQPKALYTHCAGHSLNLAILDSCSVPPIRNCIDQIKAFTLWVKHSAKRESLLKKNYRQEVSGKD